MFTNQLLDCSLRIWIGEVAGGEEERARLQAAMIIRNAFENKDSHLDLSGLGLTHVSPIKKLTWLESLNLSGNKFLAFPVDLLEMKDLKHLDLSGNKIVAVSALMDQMEGLESLNLSNNNIRRLPKNLKSLPNLSSLNLSKNKLTVFPALVLEAQNLRHLNVSENYLTEIPRCIFASKEQVLEIDVRGNYFNESEKIRASRDMRNSNAKVVLYSGLEEGWPDFSESEKSSPLKRILDVEGEKGAKRSRNANALFSR